MSTRLAKLVSILVVLASLALQFYGHACGLLLTPDSYQYLSAAQSFKTSFQFLSPDGSYYTYWPPLYPVLLSFFNNPEAIIPWLYAICTGVIAFVTWKLTALVVTRPISRVFVLAATLLSVQYCMITVFLWSEVLFLTLAVMAVYCAMRCNESNRWTAALIVSGFLLCLQRNAGAFVLAAICLAMLLESKHPVKHNLVKAVSVFMLGISGLLGWHIYLAHFIPSGFVVYRHAFFVHAPHNFATVSETLVRMFVPLPAAFATTAGLVIFIALVYAVIKLRTQPRICLVHIIVCVYWVGLVCMFWLDPHDMDRFLAGIVPFVFIVAAFWVEQASARLSWAWKRIMVVVLLLWMVYPVARTLKNVRQWHRTACAQEAAYAPVKR